MKKEILTAQESYARADVFLSEMLGGTRSSVKKLFESCFVLIDGKPAKPSQSVSAGARAEVTLPDAVSCEAKPEDIKIDIVYEDNFLAVINKPQGMTVHAGNGNTEGTLVNALLFHLDSLSGINGVIRPGIVHRIDKDTSGLLVVAKNDAAHLSLAKQIEEKTCRRTYIALLEGNLKNDCGTVTTYIGRDSKDRVKMAVVEPNRGKLAITDYTVLKRYKEGYTTLFRSRVHARYLSHPVVGDPVYGVKKQKFNLNGQLLHAWKLQFIHPATNEEVSFEAPLPEYFIAVLNKLTEI